MLHRFKPGLWNEDRYRTTLEQIVIDEAKIFKFRLPTMACWLHSYDSYHYLALIVVPAEIKRDQKRLYNFAEIFNRIYSNREALAADPLASLGFDGGVQTLVQYRQGIDVDDLDELEMAEAGSEDDVPDPTDPYWFDEIWTVVGPKKQRPAQQYSDSCVHRYRCKNGLSCKYSHTADHRAFFREQPDPRTRAMYKTKACWREDRCKYKRTSHLCPYAHDIIEARCLRCHEEGVHWTDECPITRN